MIYNKLVRDRIPEIIRNSGKIPSTEILSDERYKEELNRKLSEEVSEYLESGQAEELADIYEVILALARQKGYSAEQLETLRRAKETQRGGFADKVFLLSVDD